MTYYLDKNATVLKALYREKNRYIWEEKFYPDNYECELIDQNDVIYKDIDGEEFPIIDIDLQFGYFEERGDNDERAEQCAKALENLENWESGIIPSLKNLRLGDVVCEVVKPHEDVYGARGYTLRIYISIWEVSIYIEPDYLADQIEKAPDNKYIVLGTKMNNLTSARLFKNAIETWTKTK